MRRPAHLRPARRARACSSSRSRSSARSSRPRREALLHRHARQGRRSSSRSTCSSATRACSRSGTSASSRSARGRRASSPCPTPRSPRSCRTSRTSCARTTVGNVPSLVLAALAGGLFALVVGLPLMRLSGLAAGIATFGVLEITHNVLQLLREDRPGPEHVLLGAADDRALSRRRSARSSRSSSHSSTSGAGSGGCCARRGRMRPPRRPSASPSIASDSAPSSSPARSPGSRAASTSTCSPINTESLYLDLTFITLAMLVVGGSTSLWGAVVGALAVSGLDSFLAQAENGVDDLRRHARPARGHGRSSSSAC